MATARSAEKAIEIAPVRTETLEVALLGTSPMILHRMSEKARQELLLPKGRKTAADKAASLKHDPLEEFRAAPYTLPSGPTLLGIMSSAVKGAMRTAALDLPGSSKAQIGRLVYVAGDYTPLYGVPNLFMSITRSSDINRTPDVRTRAIVPQWVAVATITYVVPMINATSILNLLSAAGLTAGIGDWRPEKGKGNYGQFRVVNLDDPDAQAIMESGGRDVQQVAMETPQAYDLDTADLLAWWSEEVVRRGKR